MGLSRRAEELLKLERLLYDGISIPRYANILVINASHGLLLWPLMKMNPEGYSAASVRTKQEAEVIAHFSSELELILRPEIIECPDKDAQHHADGNDEWGEAESILVAHIMFLFVVSGLWLLFGNGLVHHFDVGAFQQFDAVFQAVFFGIDHALDAGLDDEFGTFDAG